ACPSLRCVTCRARSGRASTSKTSRSRSYWRAWRTIWSTASFSTSKPTRATARAAPTSRSRSTDAKTAYAHRMPGNGRTPARHETRVRGERRHHRGPLHAQRVRDAAGREPRVPADLRQGTRQPQGGREDTRPELSDHPPALREAAAGARLRGGTG